MRSLRPSERKIRYVDGDGDGISVLPVVDEHSCDALRQGGCIRGTFHGRCPLSGRPDPGEGALQRAAGEDTLLLVELPLEVMSEQLPVFKARWISGGETAELLHSLQGVAQRSWRVAIAKYEPVQFHSWP